MMAVLTDTASDRFCPGGVVDAVGCTHWDVIFNVRGERITAFLDSLPFLVNNPVLAATQFPDILGWPGLGNPFFADVRGFNLPANPQSLAPFVDTDGNSLYNPLQGDYPAVVLSGHAPFVPTEIVWCGRVLCALPTKRVGRDYL